MKLRGDGTESLGEHRIRATMEQSDRLSISLDRHATDDSLRRCLKDLDAHLDTELTTASLDEEVHIVGDRAIG